MNAPIILVGAGICRATGSLDSLFLATDVRQCNIGLGKLREELGVLLVTVLNRAKYPKPLCYLHTKADTPKPLTLQGLYLFGGWNGKRALNDLHVLDVASGTWSEALPLTVPLRHIIRVQ